MDNQLTYIILGAVIQLTLVIVYKLLRNPRIYWAAFILTIGIATFGYLNMDRPNLVMVKGNAAGWTFLPLLFIIFFGVFRQLFLKLYKNEPLIAGYMQTSWDQGEYRRLHFGDSTFTVLIIFLPFLITLLI